MPMAPVKIDPDKIRAFKDAKSFYEWLGQHHDKEDEIWIRIHKVDSGLPSITPKQAIEVVLCWGWIDGLRKGFDDDSFLQRYSRRKAKSVWSRINVDNVARLIEEGRMTEHGLKKVDEAKRTDAGRAPTTARTRKSRMICRPRSMPSRRPRPCWRSSAQNRFALAFRMLNIKTEAGRKKKIEAFVAMLKRGETIYPQGKK